MAFQADGRDTMDLRITVERERKQGDPVWGCPLAVRIEDPSRPYTQVRFTGVHEALEWLAGYIIAAGNGAFSPVGLTRNAVYFQHTATCTQADCRVTVPHGHDETGDLLRSDDWRPDSAGRVRFPRSVDVGYWRERLDAAMQAIRFSHTAGNLAAVSEASAALSLACERMLILEGYGE